MFALSTSPVASADDTSWHQLDAGEIRSTFFGKATEGRYNSGNWFTETLNTDMTSDYRDDQIGVQRGIMHFDGDSLCFAYPQVDIAAVHCFAIWQRSTNCYDLYIEGERAQGAFARILGIGWTARLHRSDIPSTCPEASLS